MSAYRPQYPDEFGWETPYRDPFDGPAPTAPRPRFKPVDAFCSEYVPLSYVVEPIIRTGSTYTVTARTGAGKTALMVIIALAVTTGRNDIVGMEVGVGRVAYLAFENPDDTRMRLKIAAHHLDVDLTEIADLLLILDARAKPEALVEELRSLSDMGEFTCVILDTFAAGFDGTDVNDNVQTGEFVRRLRPITQLPGAPALLIPAHPTKNASDDNLVPYGGGAILNEVDGNLTLARRAETGNTTLHWTGKFRGLEFAARHFRFEIVSSPTMLDIKGREVELPVLKPCSADTVEDRAKQEANVDRAVLRCLNTDKPPTIREIAAAVGRSKSVIATKLARLGREGLVEKVLDQWTLSTKGKKLV